MKPGFRFAHPFPWITAELFLAASLAATLHTIQAAVVTVAPDVTAAKCSVSIGGVIFSENTGDTICHAKYIQQGGVGRADVSISLSPATGGDFGVSFDATVLAAGDEALRGLAVLEADLYDEIIFHKFSGNAILESWWLLIVDSIDANGTITFMDHTTSQRGIIGPLLIEIPVAAGQPVHLSSSIRASAYGANTTGHGLWRLIFSPSPNLSRLIDEDGHPITGFSFSSRSNAIYQIAGGQQIPIPEPNTAALFITGAVGLALGLKRLDQHTHGDL